MTWGRVLAITTLFVATGCSSGSHPTSTAGGGCALPTYGTGAHYHPRIDASNFGPDVTNPWYPLRPGTTYRYRGVDGGTPAIDVLTVTHTTHTVDGVSARVVFDRLYESGRVVESTHDYYAQDGCGNVWYFGEDTAEFDKHGKVSSTEGSWHAGVDGAQPGVFMPAHPQLGAHFRQEWYAGHAEDTFAVADLSTPAPVPAGGFPNALRTQETSALEAGVIDAKWYAKGVGDVKELTVKGPHERFVLVRVTR